MGCSSQCVPLRANSGGSRMLNCLRIESFQSRHDRAVLENLRSKNLIPALPALEAQLKRGPPPFLRPGWVSPLQGKQVDLEWLDQPGAFAHVRGTKDGWRDASVLVVEFWATYVKFSLLSWPCNRFDKRTFILVVSIYSFSRLSFLFPGCWLTLSAFVCTGGVGCVR